MKRHLITISLTLLYWLWESQAEGNIRIDLLLLYPALAIAYVSLYWRTSRWWSLLIAAGLMVINITFFSLSYDLFDKHPG